MDALRKPEHVDMDVLSNLGPLAALAGTWEGDQGLDVSATPAGPEETRFREQMVFEPMGPVINGAQVLYGLRYTTTAWPEGCDDAFHEEVGYWAWEPATGSVTRCFMVPRLVTIMAGGTAAPDARAFQLEAVAGSGTYGILSNPFLDKGARTERYDLSVSLSDDGALTYEEDTVLRFAGMPDVFHHTDRNTLRRTAGPA